MEHKTSCYELPARQKWEIEIAIAEKLALCYRFRCSDGEILYIGNTTDIRKRLKDHRHLWTISEPIYVDIMDVPYLSRYRVETALIRRHRPTQNSFVALYDNEYKDVPEQWRLYAKIFPDKNNRFGEILYWGNEDGIT